MLDFSSSSYEELYVEHEPSARRLALSMVPADVADDIVAEAFARVLAALREGGGPDRAFRAYLLTAVRHLAYDWQQARRRLTVVGDIDVQADGEAARPDPMSPRITCAAEVQAEARDEARLITRAFGRLPARWRAVLWQLEVEGKTPAAVAPMFGLSANGVSALAMRAREGLRQAYLEEHVGTNIPAECRTYAAEFGAGARGRLGQRRRAAIQEHLGNCPSCQYLFTELTELNSRLGAILTPVALAAASSALGSAKRTVHLRAALTGHWRTWRWHPVTTVSGAAAGIAVAGGMLLAVNVTPLPSTPAHAAVGPAGPAGPAAPAATSFGSPARQRYPGGTAAVTASTSARSAPHSPVDTTSSLSAVSPGGTVSSSGSGSPVSATAPSETAPSASGTAAQAGGPAPAAPAAGSRPATVTSTPGSPSQAVTDTAAATVTGVTDTAANAVTGLANTAGTAVTGLANTAGTAITGLANTAGATVTVVTHTASGLVTAATTTVTGVTSAATGAVTGITSNAGTTLATAGKTVSSVAGTATDAATAVVGTATTTAAGVADPAVTAVTNTAAAATTAPVSAVGSVATGLAAAAGAL